MPLSLHPCLGCGGMTESPDKYAVCDRCLAELEQQLIDEQRSRRLASPARRPEGTTGPPLSQDEIDERVRRLLDSW
jgi:hypothetical protein